MNKPDTRHTVDLQTDVYMSDNGHVVIRHDDGAALQHIALEPSAVPALISALTSLAPIAGAKRAAVEMWEEAEFRAVESHTTGAEAPHGGS